MYIKGSFAHALNDGEVEVEFLVSTEDSEDYELTDIYFATADGKIAITDIVHPEDYKFMQERIADHTAECLQDAAADAAEARLEAYYDRMAEAETNAA